MVLLDVRLLLGAITQTASGVLGSTALAASVRSWVAHAPGVDMAPKENLPSGIFTIPSTMERRCEAPTRRTNCNNRRHYFKWKSLMITQTLLTKSENNSYFLVWRLGWYDQFVLSSGQGRNWPFLHSGGYPYRQRLFKNRENDTDIKLNEPLQFLNYVCNNNTPSYNNTCKRARAEDFRRERAQMHKGSYRWLNFKMYIFKTNPCFKHCFVIVI